MTACAIRYRLDGPGPATYLVDCEGQLRVYARGTLGGVMPASRLLAVLADRGCRWVPASGSVELAEPAEVAPERQEMPDHLLPAPGGAAASFEETAAVGH